MKNRVSRTGMTSERWQYLKALRPAAPRYLHVSAPIVFKANPLDAHLAPVPIVGWPRSTYSVGRNKSKRERRERRFGGRHA